MKTLTFALGLNLACVAGACLNITPNFCLNIFSISLGTEKLETTLTHNYGDAEQRVFWVFLIGPKEDNKFNTMEDDM